MYLSKTPATFSSRLESLNISEKGLICSLLNLSPLRKSMALSIRLLISSGPEWTCKACARWFGSRFIEFLVRAARVQRESTCTQNEPACPPFVSFKIQQNKQKQTKKRHTVTISYVHERKTRAGRQGRPKCNICCRHAHPIHSCRTSALL